MFDGFEGGFYNYNGVGELQVPTGWIPVWVQGTPEQNSEGFMKRPEYKQQIYSVDSTKVMSGSASVKFFVTFATMDAALVKTLDATVGKKVTINAWGKLIGRHSDGSGAGLAMQIGIDPTGGVDIDSPNVAWGSWYGQYNNWDGQQWVKFAATTIAQFPKVSVFLRAKNDYRAQNVSVWWDDVEVIVEGETPSPDSGKWQRLADELSLIGDQLKALAEDLSE